MSNPLKRLLVLRERQKAAATGVLQRSCQQRDAEQARLDAPVAAAGTADLAGDLAARQQAREWGFVRLAGLQAKVAEDQAALAGAKQALRQVELLLEAKTRRAQAKQTRREIGEQEDWVRARAHREENA